MAFNEECAVFAAWNDPQASYSTYLGLYAQQHRGQESCGIVSHRPDGHHVIRKGLGLVSEVFDDRSLTHLKGHVSIGHVRYSTSGKNLLTNTQPLTAQLYSGSLAVAHNGNLVNALELKQKLQKKGAIFQGTNDTECLLHLMAQSEETDLKTKIKNALSQLKGAFSLVMMVGSTLVVARDSKGYRPLVLGIRNRSQDSEEAYFIASETCAFDLIGAKLVREIHPGEVLFFSNEKGMETEYFHKSDKKAQCIFEHVYFSRPDSVVFGQSVYEARKKMGAALAIESPVDADLVIPVPDSGVPAAIGYSQESGIPFELGIIRNHYIGRTFIQPGSSLRKMGVKIKLNPQSEVLKDKVVVVIDDSLVRGTTSQKIIRLVRQAGAKKVHFKIASPPTTSPCYYGVDTPDKEQLIASFKTTEEIREFIGADSLSYLSFESLYKSVKGSSDQYCAACFNGAYPEI